MNTRTAWLILLSTALVTHGCATASERADPQAAEAEVRARSAELVALEEAADWEAAVAYFAPDAVIQPANAPQIRGREALLAAYSTLPPETEFEGTLTDVVVSDCGDMAWEYGVNRFVFQTPGGAVEDLGKYLVVWEIVDGQWMVKAIAFSSDAPPQQ